MLLVTARLSGETPDDEDFEEFHETVNAEPTDFAGRLKVRSTCPWVLLLLDFLR